jgi:uncharacterized glyoxalase superfamily protein PhnB
MMLKCSGPLLHVSNSAAAEQFYCDKLGFCLEFAHRSDGSKSEPGYLGISREGFWMYLSSFSGDGVAGGVVNLFVDSVDAMHAELIAKNVKIDSGPMDQTWGSREMYVKDSDGNCIRYIQM